eukprot:TRINITY_DN1633_c0_g1_i2.p1 TRINITY_DN1633_c0_g1~~TRINITY_DN1633_c0_g1_i2.p1  ORF type:complete len:389 (-),score=93.85 TRINITY_DN1633_c0_g1_i2:24-1190(-)
MRERELLEQCNHTGIVRLWGSFQDEHSLYFMLEFCGGGELFDLIQLHGPLCSGFVRSAAQQLASALRYLHSRDVVHRDVKPENVVLHTNGHLKLIDLGSAVRMSATEPTEASQDRRSSFSGTPQYMSPEMVEESASVPASDVWAFGCVVHQLLTGVVLFEAPSIWTIFQKVKAHDSIHWPQGVSSEAMQFVDQLVVVDPAARLTWEACAEHAFFEGGFQWTGCEVVRPQRNVSVPWSPPAAAAKDQEPVDLSLAFNNAAPAQIPYNEEETERWRCYLLPHEKVVKSALLRKHIRFHFTTERRFLLLYCSNFNAGRMIRIDERLHEKKDAQAQRGEITPFHSAVAEAHPSKPDYFVVRSTQEEMTLEDTSGGAAEWVQAVNDLVERTNS